MQFVVGEGVEAAEDLAHHADERPVFLLDRDGQEGFFDLCAARP